MSESSPQVSPFDSTRSGFGGDTPPGQSGHVKVGAGADVTKEDGNNVKFCRKAGLIFGFIGGKVGVQHCTLISVMRDCAVVQSPSENPPIIPFKAAHE